MDRIPVKKLVHLGFMPMMGVSLARRLDALTAQEMAHGTLTPAEYAEKHRVAAQLINVPGFGHAPRPAPRVALQWVHDARTEDEQEQAWHEWVWRRGTDG